MIQDPHNRITTIIHLENIEIQEDGYIVHFCFDYNQINHKCPIFMTANSLKLLQNSLNNIQSIVDRYNFTNILETNYKSFSTMRKNDQYSKNLLSLRFFLSTLSAYLRRIRIIHDPSLLDLDICVEQEQTNSVSYRDVERTIENLENILNVKITFDQVKQIFQSLAPWLDLQKNQNEQNEQI